MIEGALHEYKERPGTCPDCGNSPVNHFEHYVSNTLSVWSAESLAGGRGARSGLSRWSNRVFDRVEQIFLRTLAIMPFVSFSRDVQKATTYRSQVIWEEATRRSIEMEQMRVFGTATEIYRARIDGKWFYFQSIPVPVEKRSASAGWIDDKFLLKRHLRDAGVPVPHSISVRSLRDALDAFEEIGTAVVVKPRSGSRGRHTTVRVREEADVARAYEVAQKLCAHTVVEEYLDGPVCRATVIDGVLRGFFEAEAPSVVGDGTSTIAQLIQRANAQKPQRIQDIVLTEEHRMFLKRAGFNESSVPQAREKVMLSHRTGRLFGGRTREMLGSEHPSLRAYVERAARAIGVPIVGFDLIVEDPTKHPDEQRWGIIEANSLPYIDLHYLPLEGEPSNVAASVWDLWSDHMHSVGVDAAHEGATMSA